MASAVREVHWRLARAAIKCGQFGGPEKRSGEKLHGQLGDFRPASVAQRDVEHALNAVLLVIDRGAGPDQDDRGHSCDGGPAWGAGALPRSLPRRIPSANSARAAA